MTIFQTMKLNFQFWGFLILVETKKKKNKEKLLKKSGSFEYDNNPRENGLSYLPLTETPSDEIFDEIVDRLVKPLS